MNKQNVWMRWLVTGLAVAAISVAALAIAPLTSFAQTDSGNDRPATPAAPEESAADFKPASIPDARSGVAAGEGGTA